jgi:hypothetical protein
MSSIAVVGTDFRLLARALVVDERSRILIKASAIAAPGLGLLAYLILGHAPEPCEPKLPPGFIATQTASADVITQACTPGLKYTIRW